MTNANVVTIAGRPHDIRCPQTGRTDVSDCCKPMVAFTAMMEERERCAKIAEDAWNLSWDMVSAKNHGAGIAKAIRHSSEGGKTNAKL